MMPFFQPSGRSSSAGPSTRTTRIFAAVALLCAPAAIVIRALGPGTTDGDPHEVASLILIIISFLAATPVLGSRFSRITRERAKGLDEMETQLRHNALATSYFALTSVVMLGVVYAQVANMAQLWLPRNESDWIPVVVSFLLYATLLPTAVLAWRMKEEREEG